MRRLRLTAALSALLLAAAVAAQPGDYSLNLKDADIRVLIATVSEMTGRNFIVDPRVEGKVNVVSTRPMTAEEVYDVFESVLRVHGYAAIPSGSMVKIVPEAIANQDGGVLVPESAGPDTIVTKLVPLKHVSANELIQLLRPLVPQQGHLAAHQGSNALLISDRAGNVARLEQIIQRIDQGTEAAVEVIPLRHASAAELSRTLTLLADDKNAQLTGAQPAKVFADARTNSILLSGDRATRLRMRSMIAHLDSPLESDESTQVIYLNYAKAEDIVPILESTAGTLTGTGKDEAKTATIQAHAETNALVITADPVIYRTLQTIVRQLDIRRAQVLIEGIVAEVADENAKELGIQWASPVNGLDDNTFIGGTNFPGPTGGGSLTSLATNPLALGAGLTLGYITGQTTLPDGETSILNIGAVLRALTGDGRTNILSTPSIVTLDHTEAQIKVGQEVPFIQGEFTTNVQSPTAPAGQQGIGGNPFRTVERKDVGLQLTVTPHINEGDSVRLDLKQEVSSLAPTVAGAADLITNKREITTSVLVADQQLLVLGGLVSEEVKENVSKVPALGDIPVLGNLFRYRNSSRTKRNLMLFLKPTILRDAVTEATVSNDRYNYIRAEQLEVRERKENMTRDEDQPLLPPWSPPLPAPDGGGGK